LHKGDLSFAMEAPRDLDIYAGKEQRTSPCRDFAIRFIVEGSRRRMDPKSAGTNSTLVFYAMK